jgi:hypothetical protein
MAKKFVLTDYFTELDFYCTQGYGVNSSYYKQFNLLYHEGPDFGNKNKKVIFKSPIKGVVILDDDDGRGNYGNNVKIWDDVQLCAIQISHLDFNLVKDGQRVEIGDDIGEMGATGNSEGEHIHFNFMQTTKEGARVHKTKAKNWGYLDPQHPLDPNPPKFPPGVTPYEVTWIKPESVKSNENLPELPLDEEKRLHEETRNQLRKEREGHEKTQTLVDQYKEESKTRKRELEDFIGQVAQKLSLPSTSDKGDVLGAVERLLAVEDQLNEANKKLLQQEKKHEIEKQDLKEEINKLKNEVEQVQYNNKKLIKRLEELEVRVDEKTIKENTSFNLLQWLRERI